MSRDVVSAAALAGGTLALVATIGSAANGVLELTRTVAEAGDGRTLSTLPGRALHDFISAVAPVTIGAGIAATVAIVTQLGAPPAIKKLGFDLGKLSPLTNLQEAFGLTGMVRRGGSAIVKLAVVSAVIVAIVMSSDFASQPAEAFSLAGLLWSNIRSLLLAVLGVLAVIAAVDYVLARRRITARMKMSSEEIKREHRESDGDPMVKGRRRRKMRELAKRRVASAVATADVIVVNPTHYAVALRYKEDSDRAPIVVAKGVDELAEKIRELGRKHSVPIVPRPPLARALYKVKEGDVVPAALYRAVAEVLAYVYRIRRGGRS